MTLSYYWQSEQQIFSERLGTKWLTENYTLMGINHQLHLDWIQYQDELPELRIYTRTLSTPNAA